MRSENFCLHFWEGLLLELCKQFSILAIIHSATRASAADAGKTSKFNTREHPLRARFLIVLLMSFIHPALAQHQHTAAAAVDSLLQLNAGYTQQDERKLRILIQLTREYATTDPGKGLLTADDALALAGKLNNSGLLSDVWMAKAENHKAKKQYAEALRLFEQALSISNEQGDRCRVAESAAGLGSVYEMQSKGPDAIRNYEKALEGFKYCNKPAAIARVHSGMGAVYRGMSQFSKAVDSYLLALKIYEQLNDKSDIAACLNRLGHLYNLLSNFSAAIETRQRALDLYQQINNTTGIAGSLAGLGNVYENLSDYPRALDYYQRALSLNEKSDNKGGVANVLSNIGAIHGKLSDYPKALEYIQRALAINEKIDNKTGVANNLGNLGVVYDQLADFPKALEYYQRARIINEQIGNKNGLSISLGNIGKVYERLPDSVFQRLGLVPASRYPMALDYYQQSLAINREMGNKGSMAVKLASIGVWYYLVPDSVLIGMGVDPEDKYKLAENYLDSALRINKELKTLAMEKDNWAELSHLYELQGNFSKAFEAYKKHIILRDSVQGQDTRKQITQLELQFEFEKKESMLKFEKQLSDEKLIRREQELILQQQNLALANKEKDIQRLAYLKEKADNNEKAQQLLVASQSQQLQATQIEVLDKEKKVQQTQLQLSQAEVEKKQQQRNWVIAGLAAMLIFLLALFKQRNRISREKKKSEALLLNILPEEVADELKHKGYADARQFEDVTVIFTDFKDFTKHSERLSPKELVHELNVCFKAFDDIITKYHIEKIKTVGDAYLAVSGLPLPKRSHALDAVNAAIEMRDFMEKRYRETGGKTFELRCGIHSGSVIAGIVGVKKYAYDIWGDTVNLAARMEQHCDPWKINISKTTFQLIKENFICHYRGELEAKNKGPIEMYYAEAKMEK